MTPEEKIEHQKKLLEIKSKLISIGVFQMPTEAVRKFIPKRLSASDIIKWDRKASNVWNGRSTDFETYLPIFDKAYEFLKDTEKVA